MHTIDQRPTPRPITLVPATLDARARFLPRAAGTIAALFLALAVAGQLVAASQLRQAQRVLAVAVAQDPAPGTVAPVQAELDASPSHVTVQRSATAPVDAMTSAVESAADVQLAVVWLLLLGAAITVVAVAAAGRAMTTGMSASVERATRAVNALVAGEPAPPITDSETGTMGDLHAALRRLARQTRANAETAHALAEGAFRRAVASRPPEDPTGIALARLTQNMEVMAAAAQRIARGDLSVRVAPQSDDDAFGEACSAMVRRVKNVLREVEEARAALSGTIAQLRADAESLASAAGGEADTLRCALDDVTYLAVQAEADVAHAAALVESTLAGEAATREGAMQLEAERSTMKAVFERSSTVQRLAREAGLLAVKHGTGISLAEVEARELARDAAAVAAELSRLAIVGSESSHASGIVIDRVLLSARRGAAAARETEGMSRGRASRLRELDIALTKAETTALRSADTARQLAARIDLLAGHARRFDGVLRRFGKSDSAIGTGSLPAPLADGRVITAYRAAPHAAVTFPPLQMFAAT